MVSSLQNFEERFEDIENSRDGQMFKAHLKTVINDAIRAQRDEFHDYDVEYRPMRLNLDNTLSLTRTFFETIQKIEFRKGDTPSIRFQASIDNSRVLDAVRSEFGVGVIYKESEDVIILEIVGTDQCLNCVLPIMDRYRLHSDVRADYQEWRDNLVKLYRS